MSNARAKNQAATGEERWRVFCAIELPPEVRACATSHAARLREQFPEVRASWPRAENIHLTLKFMGEIARARVEELSQAAERAVKDTQPFNLEIEGTGVFPPRGHTRVLWLGVNDFSGNLTRLHAHLEDECAASGFKREERPFRPHLTLARVRAPHGSRELAKAHQETAFEGIEFSVTELVVMRSELGAGVSRYTMVSRHSFTTGDI